MWLLSVVFGFLCMQFLFCILFRAYVGYLLLRRTYCRCCSILSSSGVKQTAFALYASVLTTLCLATMW